MRKKHRRSLLVLGMGYLYLFACATSSNVWATTSTAHFNDSLPGPTIVGTSITSGAAYYNGYDWQVTSLAASQTPGDALSRTPMTPYQVYVASTVANTVNASTMTALTGTSSVGSATIPAAWIASGRSIRITSRGRYGTTGTPNWTWAVFLGTTSIMTTGAVAAPLTQTSQWFSASALLTISTTGASGTVNGAYDVLVGSGTTGTANVVSYSTSTLASVPCDLTSQLTINPVFTWGTASASNTITFTELIIELLN